MLFSDRRQNIKSDPRVQRHSAFARDVFRSGENVLLIGDTDEDGSAQVLVPRDDDGSFLKKASDCRNS